ncbi:MAG: hypothetical protein J6A47_10300 [Bacilli bacterium]|nr:hypothetical protein [Bacilli bacterium]
MKPKTITKLGAGTLAVVAIASLVGSISGTIAWFQYTTRVTANYTGVVSHMSENLQISLNGTDWKSDLSAADIQKYLLDGGREDTALRPVTTGMQEKDKGIVDLYKNPIRQYASMGYWGKADKNHDYIELPLQIRNKDVDGKDTLLSRPIYLTDLTMKQTTTTLATEKYDVAPALRVYFDAGENQYLISNNGGAIKAHGELDLDGDYVMDQVEGYGDGRAAVDYGVSGSAATVGDLPNLMKNYYIKYAPGAVASFDPSTGTWDTPTTPDVEYHYWDGAEWKMQKQTIPGDTDDPGVEIYPGVTVTSAADLAQKKKDALVLVGDVYKVGDDYYRYQAVKDTSATPRKNNLGWVKTAKGTADSYAAASFLVDDSNPNKLQAVDGSNTIDNKVIGYTYGEATDLTKLLTNESSYVTVTTNGTYLLFKNGAWVDQGAQKPAGTEYAQVETKEQANRLLKDLDKQIYAVGNVLYKWSGASDYKWVVAADHTEANDAPYTSLPSNPTNGDTYRLNISGEFTDGIYRYDNGTYVAVPKTLKLNTKIFLEGWQGLAPKEFISTEEFKKDYVTDGKAVDVGTIYKITTGTGTSAVVTYHTWTGAEFRDGLWQYDATKGWETVPETSQAAKIAGATDKSALPDAKTLLKTGTTVRVRDDDNHDAIYHWDGFDWIEGGSPVWDDSAYAGVSFEIGFRFSAPTHFDHN